MRRPLHAKLAMVYSWTLAWHGGPAGEARSPSLKSRSDQDCLHCQRPAASYDEVARDLEVPHGAVSRYRCHVFIRVVDPLPTENSRAEAIEPAMS